MALNDTVQEEMEEGDQIVNNMQEVELVDGRVRDGRCSYGYLVGVWDVGLCSLKSTAVGRRKWYEIVKMTDHLYM